MSLTPNRAAVTAAGTEARRRYADLLAREDAEGIGQRMAIETADAVLGGAADMLDRDIDPRAVWPAIARALAGPLSAFLLTSTGGDVRHAEELLPDAVASVREMALARLRAGPEAFAFGEAEPMHPAGRA